MTDSNTTRDFLFQLDEFYLDLKEDGRTISFLSKAEIEKMPYPGLRPFKTSEFQFFNGRDGQAEELIRRLRKNHFLAVIGSSGTGKSSLIRAGVIPQLLAGYMQEAGTNWDIAVCRPGKNPVENLAVALARIKCRSNDKEKIKQEYVIIEPMLSCSIYGILDYNEQLNAPDKPKAEKSNLLIIVDQFEELFRFNRDNLGKPDIENHFVNLLLKASSNTDLSIYVIITMRSEFLGDCVKYRGLPEAINEGQYLVPQLSREQIKEVIEDPIIIAGKKIAPGLVELLVNEIEESKVKKDLDQLPILQHALMRTYQNATKENATEVTYKHYLDTGGLKNALANHAQSRYNDLGDDIHEESAKQKIAKIIFQALTDASVDQKKGRRPTELNILYDIAGSIKTSHQQVNEVIDHFRDSDTSFIMPPSNTALYPELIMDISHESLMRQWGLLKEWVSDEAENGKILLRLAEYQKLKGQDEKDYLEGTELQKMWDWYQSFKPQEAWAQRYSRNYKETFKYLETSEQRWKEKQLMIANEKKKRTTRIKIMIFISLFAVIITGLLVKGYYTKREKLRAAELDKTKLTILLKKRANAVSNENKLQALFFTTEVLLLESNKSTNESLIAKSNKMHLMPTYVLKNYFSCPPDIRYVLPGDGNKTIYIYTEDSTLSEIDTQTGLVIRKVKYEPKYKYISDLFIQTQLVIFSNTGLTNVNIRDTIFVDSALYFKRSFAEIFGHDAADYINFPHIIRKVDGVKFSGDNSMIASWGQNSESIYSAADLWDTEGKSRGNSLIHDGINGVFFSDENKLIFTWGSDSTIRVWQKTTDTIDRQMPAKLFKLKIQVATGVEMDEKDYNIKIIPVNEYTKRKEEFLQEEKKLKLSSGN